jgi:hypothetical protein
MWTCGRFRTINPLAAPTTRWVTMFCKRMAALHKKSRERLEELGSP